MERQRPISVRALALSAVLALVSISSSGCVSPPEVKQASSELTTVLEALEGAERTFQRSLSAEIARTRADLESAIVAQAVKEKVDELTDEEVSGNLISLSEQVEATQRSRRDLLAIVRAGAEELSKDETLDGAGFLAKVKADREEAAKLLEDEDPEAAAEIRAKADELLDVAGRDDIKSLLELYRMERDVQRNLVDLKTAIGALQEIHATVDQWIVTDVNVSGEQIGTLVRQANEALQ